MPRLSIRTGALLLTLAALPLGEVARAQVVGAILTGTVSDPSGALVPNAKVAIQNLATGIVTETQTNAAGIYSVPNLLPGEYVVSVEAAGLSPRKLPKLSLDYRRMETASEPYFGGKLPSENLGPYMEISPLNHVDQIQTPLFVAATTGDKTVPLALHTGRLIHALRARNKVHEVKIYDQAPGDHVFLFGDSDERKDLFERAFAFLGRYLQP